MKPARPALQASYTLRASAFKGHEGLGVSIAALEFLPLPCPAW